MHVPASGRETQTSFVPVQRFEAASVPLRVRRWRAEEDGLSLRIVEHWRTAPPTTRKSVIASPPMSMGIGGSVEEVRNGVRRPSETGASARPGWVQRKMSIKRICRPPCIHADESFLCNTRIMFNGSRTHRFDSPLTSHFRSRA